MLKKIAAGLLALLLLASAALAAEFTMPVHFIGDWCNDGDFEGATWYTSRAGQNESCPTSILSITAFGYGYSGTNSFCEIEKKPVVKKHSAPSGTSYYVTVTARCRPNGPTTPGKLQTLEFMRYKHSLRVTPK